jgi:hypothetical protein
VARASAKDALLHFQGPPPLVEALTPTPIEAPTFGTLTLDAGESGAVATIAPLAVQAVPAGLRATRVLLTLPATTPPGSYTGWVELAQERRPIAIEVSPQTNLLVAPSQLELRAAGGAEVNVTLTLVNAGNVDFDLERVHAFNLMELNAVEETIHAALREQPAAGERRLDRFVDELASRHGGLVRVAIDQGAGTLAPGETRAARARLRLPDELSAGARYSSTWPLGNLNLSVNVDVAPAAKTKRPRRSA